MVPVEQEVRQGPFEPFAVRVARVHDRERQSGGVLSIPQPGFICLDGGAVKLGAGDQRQDNFFVGVGGQLLARFPVVGGAVAFLVRRPVGVVEAPQDGGQFERAGGLSI